MAGTLAEVISMLTGMLPMLDAANPNDRAFNFETICVCVVLVGYLGHNPCIVTRMVELRVIIIVFFRLNDIVL
jgi:hypothetical protein